jgi:hypothetical protein
LMAAAQMPLLAITISGQWPLPATIIFGQGPLTAYDHICTGNCHFRLWSLLGSGHFPAHRFTYSEISPKTEQYSHCELKMFTPKNKCNDIRPVVLGYFLKWYFIMWNLMRFLCISNFFRTNLKYICYIVTMFTWWLVADGS